MSAARQYTFSVAVTLVIANMIGTGVFTSLGYQVGPLPSGFVILVLWLVGGIVALSGAFTYAEIATTLKKSGGEYFFLSRLFHPALGFVAGWMSTVAGFAGAISAVALAIGEYSSDVIGVPVKVIAVCGIIIVSVIHWFGVKVGGVAQNVLTGFKLSLIVFFCALPLFADVPSTGIHFLPQPGDADLLMSAGFAISLVFVVYAYTGWNASAYIAGNLENPVKNLPRSLALGTFAVVVIYLALNATFLYAATFDELKGQNDIGNVVAIKIFGPRIGAIFSAVFSFALLSTLSAMTIAGPRVTEAIGEDYPRLKKFTARNRYGMPYIAILAQASWAIFLVLTSSFIQIIQYISVSLSVFSMIAVAGVFILRRRYTAAQRPFHMPLYPLLPLIFIVTTCWMIYFVMKNDYRIILYSAGTMLLGFAVYTLVREKPPAH